MKTILLSVLIFFFGLFAEEDGLKISDQKIVCVISQNTTSKQLKEYTSELWEKKKIQLNILQMDVNQDRLITHLKVSVDCNDGFKGSATVDFNSKQTKMSFYRDYEKNAESAFGIGAFPEKK